MKFRESKKLNIEVSALGFGCMRFPQKNNDINLKETEKMINFAIENGINYFDTAYPYHDEKSETILGDIIKGNLRDKVIIASKLPCWLIENPEDFDRILDEQLKKLKTDSIDIYLLHALFTERWDLMKKMGALKWLEKVKSAGKIKHIGFSFHDNFSVLKDIINSYDKWEFCQIQYNFMGENIQAGTEGLKYAKSKGLEIIIMEPLLGGLLANPPQSIKKIWNSYGKNPVDMALKWLWDKPEILCVLSGMSSMEQLKQNINSASESDVNFLTNEDKEIFEAVNKKYRKLNPIPCTKCRYCMPCPVGIDIPRNIEIYNEGIIYNEDEIGKEYNLSKAMYNWHMKESQKALNCIKCKICESKCPQKIEISGWMKKIDDALRFIEE